MLVVEVMLTSYLDSRSNTKSIVILTSTNSKEKDNQQLVDNK